MENYFIYEIGILIGLLAFLRPLVLARRFYGIDRLGNAIAYMFLAEAWGVITVLCFVVLTYIGFLADVSEDVQLLMRVGVFVPAILTSNHLSAVCAKIEKGGAGRPK